MLLKNYFSFVCYDGEPPAGDPPPEDKGKEKTTFTKEDLQAAVDAERKQVNGIKEELRKQLEQHKKTANLSDEERKKVEERLQSLQNELQTKEELTKKEVQKLNEEKAQLEKTLKEQAELWQNRYKNLLITNEIEQAAVKADAYNPSQINTLLRDKTQVVEELDSEGKATGRFRVVVNYPQKKDGKEQELKVSPAEALKLMQDDKDTFGNLFKAFIQGGVGLNGGGKTDKIDVSKLSPEEYRKHRATILKGNK